MEREYVLRGFVYKAVCQKKIKTILAPWEELLMEMIKKSRSYSEANGP